MTSRVEELLAENEALKLRLKTVSKEKADLQMAVSLIDRIASATKKNDVVSVILEILVTAIGGSNIAVYYEADGKWRYTDILGTKKWLDDIDCGLVRDVLSTGEFRKENESELSKLSIPGYPRTYETWGYPLKVGEDVFGAVRLQGMAIKHAHYRSNIDPFIQYSSLVLYHEISNVKTLQTAYRKISLARDRLQESEEKFRQLIENVNKVFWIRDARTNDLLYMSPNFEDIWGMSIRKISEDTDSVIDAIHPEDRSMVAYKFQRQNLSKAFELDYRILRPADGTVRWIHEKNFPIPDKSGKIYRRAGVSEDITERIQMEAKLRQAQKMESIGNLAGGIAHDFNNILFPIVGMAELLLDDLPAGSQARENAREILTAGLRGSELVKQILSFSRHTDQEPVPVKIQQVLRDVLKLCRASIPADIDIREEIEPQTRQVMSDPTQLHQVAMNLITNAYHALEDGGRITVRLDEVVIESDNPDTFSLAPGPHARLRVSDNGTGIPADILNKIFDPYFTTKKKGKGTGLGLAVVHGIVKDYSGDILVDSTPGRGTIVTVYIPIAEQQGSQIEDAELVCTERGCESILVVDDEPAVVRLERLILERLGYRVTAFNSSTAALDAVESDPWAYVLVISDMTMPNLTGDQLTRQIHSIRPELPVIICTGYSERLNLDAVGDIGVKGVLMKPIVRSDMADMVRKTLDAT
ncbi:MAG TPA: hybrid sensor histidine kinase/response regulator [Desulfobacteraceae bacterium]|nr:hybrid sensor histidine kinase/response regulator [Desulfobacteraceae bacterium]